MMNRIVPVLLLAIFNLLLLLRPGRAQAERRHSDFARPRNICHKAIFFAFIVGLGLIHFLGQHRIAAEQEQSSLRTNLPIELITNTAHSGWKLSISPDGRFFAVPAVYGVDLWDVQKGRRIRRFVGLGSSVG